MFIWSVNTIIKSFENLLPEMYDMFIEGDDFGIQLKS